MNKVYKFIMLISGILIIINVMIGMLFNHDWSEMFNVVVGLILILFGINYSFSKRKK